MKKLLTTIMAGALITFAGASYSMAEESSSKSASFSGEVTSIAGKAITVAQKGEGQVRKQETFTVDDSTKVLRKGRKVEGGTGTPDENLKFEDIKVGDKVTVQSTDGKVTEVHVAPPKPAKVGGEQR